MDKPIKITLVAMGAALLVGVALISFYRATAPSEQVQTVKLDFNRPTDAKSQQEAKNALTRVKAQALVSAAQLHLLRTNQLPTSLSDLEICEKGKSPPNCEVDIESRKDGWGNDFELIPQGGESILVRSRGTNLDSPSDDIEIAVTRH